MKNTLPAFRLFAGEKDITSMLAPMVSSIAVTDETGYASDTLELEIADPDGSLELPRTDSWLTLHLGFKDGVMRDFGRFAVKEVSAKGPPDVLTVHAVATPMAGSRRDEDKPAEAPVKQSLHTTRSVSYKPGPMSKLLAEVCIRSDLIFRAPPEIWHDPLPHIVQDGESDLSLVSRLAEERGCIVKVTGNVLCLTRRSAAQTVSGEPLMPHPLRPSDISEWGCRFGGVKPYRSAVCRYYDKEAAMEVEVMEGTEPPTYSHPYTCADKESAQQRARSILQRNIENSSEINFRMPMDVSIVAEQPVELTGFRDGLNGRWIASRVEHRFDKSGAVTSIQGRQTA